MLKIAYGRFNPPTIGHLKLFEKADLILTTDTVNVNNPLTFIQKYKYLSGNGYTVYDKPMNIFKFVENYNSDNILLYCGKDREVSYKKLINTHGVELSVINRNDNVSATLARKYAIEGDYESFAKIVLGEDVYKYNIYLLIRKFYEQLQKTLIEGSKAKISTNICSRD